MPASPRFIILALVLIAAALRAAEPALTLRGPGKTVTLTAGEFAALPHAELRAIEPHEKKERSYSGVKMADLLRQIDAPLGENGSVGRPVRTRDQRVQRSAPQWRVGKPGP